MILSFACTQQIIKKVGDNRDNQGRPESDHLLLPYKVPEFPLCSICILQRSLVQHIIKTIYLHDLSKLSFLVLVSSRIL